MKIRSYVMALVALCASQAGAQGAEELAKQLANPVAALIQVSFQLNYDRDIGAAESGERGVRYWAESPASGPHGWAAGAGFVLLFPK